LNIIDAQDITKIYQSGFKKRNITALDNVSMSVMQGEIFGLLGPNGAGKTTFLKVVLGIAHASSGEVFIGEYKPSDARSRMRIGYLPENHRFPNHLTGQGLLVSTARLYGMNSSEYETRAKHMLELVDMSKWGDTKIKKYSKGMQQRIGLAQAMMPNPDVLLLDEPTDGVDPIGKIEIRKVLEKIREEGKSIVLNSHLLSEVESVADRVAILSRGKLVRINTMDEMTVKKSQYEIEADIGNVLVKIPEKIGNVIKLSTKELIIELKEDENINYVIDELRHKKISIKSVKPSKVSLEQSFIDTISGPSSTNEKGDQL